MKQVLIVAGIREAFTRVFPLGAYLPEFGWAATILTPGIPHMEMEHLYAPRRFMDNATIVEVPFPGDVFRVWRRLLRAAGFNAGESLTEQIKARTGLIGKKSAVDTLMRWYETIFAFPDAERGWKDAAVRRGDALLRSDRFDALMTSSPFPTTHVVAAKLKQRHGLFWLADFRDLWTKNHNYLYGSARRWLEEHLERRALRRADVITGASPSQAYKQQMFHGRPVSAIPVGFDPDSVNDPPAPLTRKFTLTYTGTIYAGNQDPEKVLSALSRLIRQGRLDSDDVEVRFYGARLSWLDRLIAELGVSATVVQYGPVSRAESLQRQRESHVLLLFNWEDPAGRGVYPLKLFEYLAARRPILSSGGVSPDDVGAILGEAEGGVYATTPAAVERAILGFYRDYQSQGSAGYRGRLSAVMEYDHRNVARKFAQLLGGAEGGGCDRQTPVR